MTDRPMHARSELPGGSVKRALLESIRAARVRLVVAEEFSPFDALATTCWPSPKLVAFEEAAAA